MAAKIRTKTPMKPSKMYTPSTSLLMKYSLFSDVAVPLSMMMVVEFDWVVFYWDIELLELASVESTEPESVPAGVHVKGEA